MAFINEGRPVSRMARRTQLPGGAQRNFETEYNRRNSSARNNRSTSRRPTGSGGDTARPWVRRAAYSNTILLVHGLEHLAVNCDQVFNLFCLYGNVSIVKILKDKQVLVELEDIEAAKRCVENLHLLPLGDGRKLQVKYSKHSYIYHGKIHRLEDGTPAHKVYPTSRLNRFRSTRTRLEKTRPAGPSKILHFYNAPTDICGVKLQKAVTDVVGRTDAVKSIVILPVRQGIKCSTGLIEMKTIDSAAKVISRLNHVAFTSTKSRFPFMVKLCFSKWSEIKQSSSAVLLGTIAPHKPWQRHGSEQRLFTSEFPVTRKTRVAGGDNNHASWMLWSMSGDTAEINAASADDPREANRPLPAGHQQAGSEAEDASSVERHNGAREDGGDAAM